MLGAQKFVENVYYHELARSLVKLGYQIENKPRGDFEIKGVSPELVKKFSKRHNEIDQKTRELLEREPEKAEGNLAAIRENIAHKERARKIRDIGFEKLQAIWDGQMTSPERESLGRLTTKQLVAADASENVAEKAVAWAEEHLFERPGGAAGPAFLVTSNFNVLKRYIDSDAYALAMGELSDRLRGAGPIRAAWPRDDVQPSRHERVALQRRLADLGYTVKDFTGHLDFDQRDAVRELQQQFGMTPDGHPSPQFLARLGVRSP